VKIAPSKQVPVVASRADLFFVFVGNDHHFDVSIKIELDTICGRGDLADSGFGFCNAALSDQPPWRFWREEGGENDWDWPDPLQCEGDSVSPLRYILHQSRENAGGQQPTNHPAHVDP
jgi:hypothetical protein